MNDSTFFLKQKLFQLAPQLHDDFAARQIAVKDTLEEDESRDTAGFEQIVEILHSLLWLSNLKREQAIWDARPHALRRHQLYKCGRVVKAGHEVRKLAHVIEAVDHLCTKSC